MNLAEYFFIHTDDIAYEALQRNINPSPIRLICISRPLMFISMTPANPIRLPIISYTLIFSSLNTNPVMNMQRKTPDACITEAFIPVVLARPI